MNRTRTQTLLESFVTVAATLILSVAAGCSDSQPTPASDDRDHDFAEPGHAGDSHDDHGDEEAADSVSLSAQQIQRASIELAEAGAGTIREQPSLYGMIAPNAERVREVTARFPGAIRSVSKRVGDPVRQGETLATVESNESLRTYAVTSPLTGVVTARDANPGEQTGNQSLFTVADLATVWVEVSLFPRDRAQVRVGQSVRVRSTDTGQSAEGQVTYVAPFGSASSQTLTARVLLDNQDGRWAPGLYVSADVTLAEILVPVAIRNEALQTLDERSVVFLAIPDGFRAQPVRIGRSDAELTEILDGLKAGDRYVTRNSFILKADLGKGTAEHED